MSFGLKVIAVLQWGPWNFWKLQNYPCLPPPPPALFCAAAHRRHRRRRRGEASRTSRPLIRRALSPTRRPEPPPPLLGFALALHLPAEPRAPPLPEPPRRPPPRRRRGEPKPEAQLSIFRAPEHYKKPRALFLSSFRRFPNPTPQNAAAAHPERRRASPRRGAATPGPLHPNSPTFSRVSTSRSSQAASHRPILAGATSPPLASAAKPPCSAEPPPPSPSPQP